MSREGKRWFSAVPLFDPTAGITVLEPLSSGSGWWVGAPSILFDSDSQKFYLYYRRRKPRELGRGTYCAIAESSDGISFDNIWEMTKEDLDTPSIEKSSLCLTLDGKAHLYISYVDPKTSKWRIDLLRADSFDQLSPSSRSKIFTAEDVGAEGIKDPYVLVLGHLYYMILSYAPSPLQAKGAKEEMHATADVYNTGITKSHTGLAVSHDGINFRWEGDVLSPPDRGWDAYATRISCVLSTPPIFTAFYDGSISVDENYEERTGLATTVDLRRFERITDTEPILISPHGSGSLRYMDAIIVNDQIYYYYEYVRADGSHELRLSVVELQT